MKRINLADSKEWYVTKEQAEAYISLIGQSYGAGIVSAEDTLLSNNLERICEVAADKTSYIDLGPGNGKKTLFLCQALKTKSKLESYVAVDIQSRFLEVANRIGSELKIPTMKVNSSFEEFLAKDQPFENHSKFIYLGATFGNFTSDSIEHRLCKFMKAKDLVYLSAGLKPKDVESLAKGYEASLPMFEPVAEMHCLKGGRLKSKWNPSNSSIEQIYEINEKEYILGVSKKHSVESFKDQTSRFFNGNYFIEGDHIGFIGKKK